MQKYEEKYELQNKALAWLTLAKSAVVSETIGGQL